LRLLKRLLPDPCAKMTSPCARRHAEIAIESRAAVRNLHGVDDTT
jgi:hypothetical protein